MTLIHVSQDVFSTVLTKEFAFGRKTDAANFRNFALPLFVICVIIVIAIKCYVTMTKRGWSTYDLEGLVD